MKRNTWKGSYDRSITLKMGRSTEVIHCADEISTLFTNSKAPLSSEDEI